MPNHLCEEQEMKQGHPITLDAPVQQTDDYWHKKIAEDFQRTVPDDIKGKLDNHIIYNQLNVLSKQNNSVKKCYSDADPALFQGRLQGKLNRQECFDYLTKAAQIGNMDLVQWLIAEKSVNPNQDTLKWAAGSGNMDLVQWLIAEKNVIPDKITLNFAVYSGNTEFVQWLIAEKNVNPNQNTVEWAEASDNIKLAQYLRTEISVKRNPDTIRCLEKLSGSSELEPRLPEKKPDMAPLEAKVKEINKKESNSPRVNDMTFFQKWRHLPYKWHLVFISILLVGLAMATFPFVFQFALLIPSYLKLPMTILGGLTTALSSYLYIKKINKIQPPNPEGAMEQHNRGVGDQNGIDVNNNNCVARYGYRRVVEQGNKDRQDNLSSLLVGATPVPVPPPSTSGVRGDFFMSPPEVKGGRPDSSPQPVSSSPSIA